MSTPPSPAATPLEDSIASPPGESPPNDSTASQSGEPPGEEPSGLCLYIFPLFLLVCIVLFVILVVVDLDDIITKSPRFYLSDLRGPSLDANPGSAVTVCEFTFSNTARLLPIRYRRFDITLRHPSGREATGTITGFRQGLHSETREEVSLQFSNDTPAAVPLNRSGVAVFRVSLETVYRYEVSASEKTLKGWWTRVRRGSDVEVNGEGKMASGERILLVSAVGPGVASTGWLAVVVVVGSLILIA